MNKKVRVLLVITMLLCFVFALSALITFGFSFYYTASSNDWSNLLPAIYSFLHLIITVVAVCFSIRSLRKGSVIMRTIMYVNDYKELTPSKPTRIFFIIVSTIFLAVGIYFGLSFIINAPGLFGFGFPLVLRLVLTNVGFYISLLGLMFIIFPFVYDIKVDIEERKNKYKTIKGGNE